MNRCPAVSHGGKRTFSSSVFAEYDAARVAGDFGFAGLLVRFFPFSRS
jgi:hypothetical protein